ncbi:MUC3B protein, partial [Brachypteracias leptosomus]|nr:MUC3B protein [Brachypteracias leptosomus]
AAPCLNGGHWTGLGCLCPPNLEGDRCQFGVPTINLTAELGPSLELETRVTNRDFSKELEDPSSTSYRSFVEEFGRREHLGWPEDPHVPLPPPRRGSVVVTYDLLLHPPPGDAATTPLDHLQELLEATKAPATPQNCSDPSAAGSSVLAVEMVKTFQPNPPHPTGSSPELCRRRAPTGFGQFYFAHRVGTSLLCVTNCTLNLPGTFNCHGG